MAPIDWILVVSTGIVGVLGLFCLFDGARRIALNGLNDASGYLVGVGAAICLAVAGYAYWKYGVQAEFVMWLVWGVSALVFGPLFAREPAPPPAYEDAKTEPMKIEPVLAPPVVARAPQPAAASAKPVIPAPAPAPAPAAAPLLRPAIREDTVPLRKPSVGGDTVPLPKPAVGADTVPLPKPSVGGDTVPLPKPGFSVDDTVPLAKPAPGTFTPPKKP